MRAEVCSWVSMDCDGLVDWLGGGGGGGGGKGLWLVLGDVLVVGGLLSGGV